MLCVVSGQHRYLRKIFNGKTFEVSKNPQKLRKFSPLNDLACMVYPNIVGDVTGNTAPYHITQPLTDDIQIVSSIATMANMTCSLNDTVPSHVTFTWLHDGNTVLATPSNEIIQTNCTIMLLIRNLQASDAGIYQCVINDTMHGWILQRNITLGKLRAIEQ